MTNMPGVITGGTECYGGRYKLTTIRLTSTTRMFAYELSVAPY